MYSDLGADHSSGEYWFESSCGIVPETHQLHLSIIQDLVSLRHLTFKICNESAIDWLESVLGVPPKLEELNILYEHWELFSSTMDCDDVEGIFKGQLQQDDKIFGSMCTSGRFPSLGRINVMLAVHHVLDDDTLEMRLRRCLPFIHGTGMLVVKVGTYADGDQFIRNASIVPQCG